MDVSYQYLEFFLEDDDELEQIRKVTIRVVLRSCMKSFHAILSPPRYRVVHLSIILNFMTSLLSFFR